MNLRMDEYEREKFGIAFNNILQFIYEDPGDIENRLASYISVIESLALKYFGYQGAGRGYLPSTGMLQEALETLKVRNVPEEKYNTYNGWMAEGRYIIKGQKSHKRNEKGECVFALSQTVAAKLKKYNTDYIDEDQLPD